MTPLGWGLLAFAGCCFSLAALIGLKHERDDHGD